MRLVSIVLVLAVAAGCARRATPEYEYEGTVTTIHTDAPVPQPAGVAVGAPTAGPAAASPPTTLPPPAPPRRKSVWVGPGARQDQ